MIWSAIIGLGREFASGKLSEFGESCLLLPPQSGLLGGFSHRGKGKSTNPKIRDGAEFDTVGQATICGPRSRTRLPPLTRRATRPAGNRKRTRTHTRRRRRERTNGHGVRARRKRALLSPPATRKVLERPGSLVQRHSRSIRLTSVRSAFSRAMLPSIARR